MCSCDYDLPSVWSLRFPTARKPYRCEECGGAIDAGQIYERCFAVWDGVASTVRTCMHCVELREFMKAEAECFCPLVGSLIDDARTEIRECRDTKLLFSAGRRIVMANKRRRAWMVDHNFPGMRAA